MNKNTDLKVKGLRILIDTNRRLLETQKSNKARLKNIKELSQFGFDTLYADVVEPLKKPLGILKIRIETMLKFIPIYKDYLSNIQGLSMFDAGELISLVDDVSIEQRDKFISYCGFSPVVVCDNNYSFKMKKGKDYSDCDIVGDEKSKKKDVTYNERAKKHVIKIIDRLVQYNDEYQDAYNNIWLTERQKDPKATKKHINHRTKRKLCIKFLKEYRRKKIEINRSME